MNYTHKTLKSIFILSFLLVGVILFMTSCNKKDTECEFYTKGSETGQLYLEHKTGDCYYLENGNPQYLKREDCAWYCK